MLLLLRSIVIFSSILNLNAQLDSILINGKYRSYQLHIPKNYNTSKKYPIVLNLHGLNSNGPQQEFYSGMSMVADTLDFIVVYPNGLNNQWNIVDNSDVDYLDVLVEYIRSRYSCSECLFSAGMSYGAFMTYKYVCASRFALNAIAPVAGNMPLTLQNDCPINYDIPIIHFHGTADNIVKIEGVPPFIPSVENTILHWVGKNKLNWSPIIFDILDSNKSDDCTASFYLFFHNVNKTEVIFYQILNGGHTWPGAIHFGLLGPTNQDINASSLIGRFFMKNCNSSNHVLNEIQSKKILIHPNPAQHRFFVESESKIKHIEFYSMYGNKIYKLQEESDSSYKIPNEILPGLYLLKINTLSGEKCIRIVLSD